MQLHATIRGTTYRFGSVKEVLAKANPPKSGDDLAGVSARDPVERVAARAVLSEITLRKLRESPVVPYEEDELTRMVEDHGVCLSSCLDYWDDELVLQAFNRSLTLAPEIYGNPWFLRDDELPKLARLFNLHRRYGTILVNGMELPEATYGPHAVSRGDDSTRFLTPSGTTRTCRNPSRPTTSWRTSC